MLYGAVSSVPRGSLAAPRRLRSWGQVPWLDISSIQEPGRILATCRRRLLARLRRLPASLVALYAALRFHFLLLLGPLPLRRRSCQFCPRRWLSGAPALACTQNLHVAGPLGCALVLNHLHVAGPLPWGPHVR